MSRRSRHRLLLLLACLLPLSADGRLLRRTPSGLGTAGDRRGVGLGVWTEAGPPTDGQPQYFHWPRLPVRVFLDARSGADQQSVRIATAGFDEWSRATRGAVGYERVGTPSQAQITVRFTPGPTVPGHGDLVGITNMSWTGPVLETAEIVLAVGQRTPGDLQTVAAHEFGHALGIRGHSPDMADLMFPALRRPQPPGSARSSAADSSPTAHDLDDLAHCYPALRAPSRG